MSESEGKRADKIGAYAEQGNVYIDTLVVEQSEERATLKGIPQNVPLRGATKFVGRDDDLKTIHEQLQRRDRVVTFAIAGMSGVGKTELAIQYAVQYAQEFPGGICWLNAKETDLVGKIFSFVRLCLHQTILSKFDNKPLTLDQQFELCLQDWKPNGAVLMVLDDVSEATDFQSVVQKLPSRFRVLLTTQVRQLDASFFELPLDILAPEKALELLTELMGQDRIQSEQAVAQQLCAGLGYLPLGLELVGRYVAAKPFLSLAEMQERLNIQHEAIAQRPQNYVMTGQRSVTAAFELSWEELNDKAQEMGRFLSLFAADAIPWSLVKWVTEAFEWTTEEMEAARTALYHRSLLQKVDQTSFRLHPLIQEFLAFKLAHSEQADQVRATFAEALIAVAREIPLVLAVGNAEWCEQVISHLEAIAQTQIQYLSNEDLLTLTGSLGRFYKKQALYDSAEFWYTKCLKVLSNRAGDDHPINTISLVRLVNLQVVLQK
ncbi:MAG: hypothetical protein KME13_27170 [Myxacorys californica WJT36-NPBG1]|jgi:hypothetical protein|nr:hypothetical protein [Myxacorys californica WJT36-NPBG1]